MKIGKLIIICVGVVVAEPAIAGDLTVLITNANANRGTIRVGLYDGAPGFPNKGRPRAHRAVAITPGPMRVTFPNIEPGTYAVSLYHDGNANKKLDTNLIGIPVEGVGISNNARGRFGPPKFNDAAFSIDESDLTISIIVKYF